MDEQRNQARSSPSKQELEEYACKLARVTMQVNQMTAQQRQSNAQKIQQLKERIEQLPDWLHEIYRQELLILGKTAASVTPVPKENQPAEHLAAYDEQGASLQPSHRQAEMSETVPPAAQQPKKQPEMHNEVQISQNLNEPAEPAHTAHEDLFEQDEDSWNEPAPHGKRRIGCLLLVIILGLMLALGGYVLVWGMNDFMGNRGRTIETKSISVEKGSHLQLISKKLEESGIIRSKELFQLYVKLKKQAGALQYGTFELRTDMGYDELLEQLKMEQKRDTVRVTFPEGIPAVQFAARMQAAGLCTADEFLDVANNGDFSQFKFWNLLDENPNQFMKCEGYLFPDTYEFYKEDTVYNMVAKIYAEFDAKFTDEMYAKVQEMGFTLSQFMTLASIVQEEAGPPDHQADVAAVFMNRLVPGSPVSLLQSNCSSYIKNDNDNNYIHNTIAPYYGGWENIPPEVAIAYDTYQTPGLPAGPISNPGMDAMLNTMNYKSSQYVGDYYFFVTDLAGTYYYAKTDSEHEMNKAAAHKVNKSLQQAG